MSLVLIPVKVTARKADGTAVAGATVRAVLTVSETDDGLVVPSAVAGLTDLAGEVTLNLWPNSRGVNGSQYRVEIQADTLYFSGLVTIPEAPSSAWPVELETIINQPPYPSRTAAEIAQAKSMEYMLQAKGYHDAAQGFRDSAEDAAEAAQFFRMYDTLAAGEAATVNGQVFYVRVTTGHGAYEYKRTATGSAFQRMRLFGYRAREIEIQRVIGRTLAPAVPGHLFDLWGSDGWEHDGRVIPNRLSSVPPTLNLLPDPFNPLDELGTTPARTPNTTDTTDSTGVTNYALKLSATAQTQQLTVYRSTYGAIPNDNYRLLTGYKFLGGVVANAAQWRLGTTGGLLLNATGAWQDSETTLAAYAGATDIGISSAVGNTDGVLAIANFRMYGPLAGESASLPTFAQELAAQSAGHMKRCLSHPGAFSLTAYGSINVDGATGADLITLDPAGVTLTNGYTIGGWFDCTQVPAGGQAIAYGFDAHANLTNGASGTTHGQFGVYGSGSANTTGTAYRLGKMYAQPTLGALASTPAPLHYFPNQGKQFIALTATPNAGGGADYRLHVNEVPVELGNSAGWTVPKVARMLVGAWNNSGERRKTANPWKGNVDGLFMHPAPMTQEQIHQRGRYMVEQLRLAGDTPGLRKTCFIANGDSLSAFSPSYIWHLSDRTDFSPRLHLWNVAQGGTTLEQAMANPRKAAFLDMIRAAVRAGYERVVILARWGTNELTTGKPSSWITNNGHQVWRDNYYRPFINEVKAIAPGVVEWWHVTMPYRYNLGNSMAQEVTYHSWVDAYNDDFRDNGVSTYNVNRILDIGLGTERMTADGVFVPEARLGGRPMMNWRCMNAAKDASGSGAKAGVPNRSPAVALNLSALAGAAITATAPAGTFLWHDLYRKVVAGALGYGRIIAISPDGSQATLDTTNRVPAAWVGEPAMVTTRDTVTRGTGFDALAYAGGAWSIQSCAEEWLTDGLHQANFGGREECDYVAPTIQTYLSPLSGVVA